MIKVMRSKKRQEKQKDRFNFSRVRVRVMLDVGNLILTLIVIPYYSNYRYSILNLPS